MNGVASDPSAVVDTVFDGLSEVNADVDSRHGILVSRLRKTRVRAQYLIKFTAVTSGWKGGTARRERNVVSAEDQLQDLRRDAALDGVARVMIRHRICGLQRCPVRHSLSSRIAIGIAQP